MRVRLLTARVGDGFVQKFGDILELPEDEAGRMIADQLAAEMPVIETAVESPDENMELIEKTNQTNRKNKRRK